MHRLNSTEKNVITEAITYAYYNSPLMKNLQWKKNMLEACAKLFPEKFEKPTGDEL